MYSHSLFLTGIVQMIATLGMMTLTQGNKEANYGELLFMFGIILIMAALPVFLIILYRISCERKPTGTKMSRTNRKVNMYQHLVGITNLNFARHFLKHFLVLSIDCGRKNHPQCWRSRRKAAERDDRFWTSWRWRHCHRQLRCFEKYQVSPLTCAITIYYLQLHFNRIFPQGLGITYPLSQKRKYICYSSQCLKLIGKFLQKIFHSCTCQRKKIYLSPEWDLPSKK